MNRALKNIEKDILHIVKGHSQIIAAYLFGSYARGKPTPLSDIDIAILINRQDSNKANNLNFEFEVESELLRQLPEYSFDVRNLNDAPILIQGKIITEGRLLLVKDQRNLSDFVEYIIPRYLDFRIDYNFLQNKQYQAYLNGR